MPVPADTQQLRTIATERWLPPVLLAVSVVLALALPGAANAGTGPILALSAALVVLLGIAFAWIPAESLERVSPRWAAWFTALTAVTWLACLASPLFGFSAWSGYLLATRVFPVRRLWIGALMTASTSALSQVGGDLDGGTIGLYLGLIVANTAIAGLALYYAWGTENQSEQRREALAAAEAANARLETALTENRALQEQLVLGAREAGIADERARLAREIHDTIAQGLSGIVRQLEATDGEPTDEVARRIAVARELARDSLSEARRSVHALRPEPLEAAHLPDALATVVADWSRLHGVPAAVTTSGDPCRLHPEIDVALLRTAQEALTNVAKHARAGRAGITLSYMGDEVVLDVRDDGTGFDPDAAGGDGNGDGGYGLVAMRERLAAVGGRLVVESAPGDGAALSATVPAVEPR